MISKDQAQEYEVGKCNLLVSFIHLWFPFYFSWVCRRRYSRYKGFMDFKTSEKYKQIKKLQLNGNRN